MASDIVFSNETVGNDPDGVQAAWDVVLHRGSTADLVAALQALEREIGAAFGKTITTSAVKYAECPLDGMPPLGPAGFGARVAGKDRYRLALLLHHVVSDGWSLIVLLRALEQYYGDILNHRTLARRLPQRA